MCDSYTFARFDAIVIKVNCSVRSPQGNIIK
jgi:hypothetical protein